jgi:flagellar protein FlgJ
MNETNPIIGGGRPALTDQEDRQLRQACRDLEEVFMRYVVREMGLLAKQTGGGPATAGSAQYGALAEEAMASALTDAGGIGIADTLYTQLKEAVAGAAREISQAALELPPGSPTSRRDRLGPAPAEDETAG